MRFPFFCKPYFREKGEQVFAEKPFLVVCKKTDPEAIWRFASNRNVYKFKDE
jgi:hypothetical protein